MELLVQDSKIFLAILLSARLLEILGFLLHQQPARLLPHLTMLTSTVPFVEAMVTGTGERLNTLAPPPPPSPSPSQSREQAQARSPRPAAPSTAEQRVSSPASLREPSRLLRQRQLLAQHLLAGQGA